MRSRTLLEATELARPTRTIEVILLLPAPNESDPEDVTTALETAAIFAARGDVSEASRWLGRAADFANLAGHASRAETLALSARALSATRADGDSSDDTDSEEIARPLPEPPAKRVSVRPQAPSERPQDRDAGNSQPMLLVSKPAATPAAPAARSVSPAATPAAPAARPQGCPDLHRQPLARVRPRADDRHPASHDHRRVLGRRRHRRRLHLP